MKSIVSFIAVTFFFTYTVNAQDTNDSLINEIAKTTQRFSTDTNTVLLMSRLEKTSLQVDTVIQNIIRNFNTSAIEKSLDDIEQKLIFSEKYINTTDEHFSYRLLRVHSIFLSQMKNRMDDYTYQLRKYNREISKVENDISSFIADSSYKRTSANIAIRNIFLTQYNQILHRWLRADSLNKKRELQITRIQSRLTNDYMKLSQLSENVSVRMENFNLNILKPSDKPLLSAKKSDYSKSIFEVMPDSAETSSAIMLYYLASNLVPIILTLLLCLVLVIWIIYIRNEYRKNLITYLRTSNIRLKYLSNYPLYASLLLGFSISLFFFPHPPIIFVEVIWTILGLILTVLFFKDKNISVPVRVIWAAFFITFRIVAVMNLFLYASFEERWLLFPINITCITLDALILYINKKKHIFHLKRTAWVIYISATLHILSMICNFSGLFNLARILTTTATFGVFTAATLRVFADAGLEALTFQLAMLKRKFAETHEKSITRIYNFCSSLLNIFAVTAWFIIFLNNLNLLEYLKEQSLFYLYKPIPIGSTFFTIGSILLFIFIILASAFISNLISVITDITATRNTKYTFLSNAKLVIKLLVITAGILFAFFTTGIPLDKIAIVLGALSVGIGFGLQNLVSNLIAGVMITLEHPIRIGDVVEIGKYKGVIKEIGIRSSKIISANGCDVIVPNNDILSQQVVNWTLSNPHTRIEFDLFIEDSNDLIKAKTIITETMDSNQSVIKNPAPIVVVNSIANAAIGFTCYFWCENISQVSEIKGDVLENIYAEFKKQSITIKDNSINIKGNFNR